MADPSDSSLQFFSKATPCQWEFVLSLYKDVLRLKAQSTRGNKKGGPEELIKLDNWFQETLPTTIHSRKEAHLTHEEIVQVTKWKLLRGKARARLMDLVRINTELAVKQATTKAFKKVQKDLNSAISALTNLKGIGPATASAVLAAGYPEHCPYMADESMLSTPGVEANDYTVAEFVNYAEQIKNLCIRIKEIDPEGKWTPHKMELALWTHYVSRELKPALLDDMPLPDGKPRRKGAAPDETREEDIESSTEAPPTNGKHHHEESESKDGLVPSFEENSTSNLSYLSSGEDITRTSGGDSALYSALDRPLDDLDEPALKKLRAAE